MNIINNSKFLSIFILFLSGVLFSIAYAGDDMSEEDIKLEISYLANKLLEMKGEESYTIESDAKLRPFLGVCSAPDVTGVELTCVTPGSQAEKGGLLTGDVLTNINGVSLIGENVLDVKEAYYSEMKKMETGKELKLQVERAGKPLSFNIKAGSVQHPSYKCTIGK